MNPSPQPFSQRWTPEDTRQRVEMPDFPSDGTPTEQHQWRQNVLWPLDQRLAQAIGEHIAWLMGQGVAVIPPHAEGLKTPLLHSLRALAETPNDPDAQAEAGKPFVNHLSFYFLARQEQTKNPAFHEDLVAYISAGDFKRLCGDLQTCQASGLRVNYNFHGWNGVAGQLHFGQDPDHRFRSTFEPLGPDTLAPPQAYTAALPVPSGVLFIADWIRIPAFNALTKKIDDADSEAIQSETGRALICKRYVEELGVAHVPFPSPSIVASMGAITAGHFHREEDSGEEIEPKGTVGRIQASLRWTTVVDRQHLVNLLTPQLGSEEAEAQVAAYQANAHDLIVVNVEPGTHHLYWSGARGQFDRLLGEKFQSDGLFLAEDYEDAGFALTQDPLAPAIPNPASKRKPGPGR